MRWSLCFNQRLSVCLTSAQGAARDLKEAMFSLASSQNEVTLQLPSISRLYASLRQPRTRRTKQWSLQMHDIRQLPNETALKRARSCVARGKGRTRIPPILGLIRTFKSQYKTSKSKQIQTRFGRDFGGMIMIHDVLLKMEEQRETQGKETGLL